MGEDRPDGARSRWTPLGEPGSGGRITSIAINPEDPERILVGGDMLGVGLSTDGGTSWQATTGFSSWEINDFTWSPYSRSTVWVGTMSGPYLSVDGGRTWRAKRQGMPRGDYPYSAPVQKVLIDPADEAHLLAFGGNQRMFKAPVTGALNYGVVYESTDGGDSWTAISSVGKDTNVLDVVTAGPSLRTLYVAARGAGVLRSSDGGATWAPANDGLPHVSVRGLTIDPSDPQRVWAALDRSPAMVDGRYQPGGIYRTDDGGATWTAVNAGLPQNANADAAKTTAMHSVHRTADGILFTADQGYLSQSRFRSSDGGDTWTRVSGAVERFFPASTAPLVWASSHDGRRIIGGTTDIIMGSADGGGTWQDLGSRRVGAGAWRGNGFSGLLGTRVAFNAARPGLMLLTGFDAGNILRSADGGASWTRPNGSWDQYGGGYDVTAGGTNGDVAYAVLGQAGVFNGLAVSRDAGATWTTRAAGTLPKRYAAGANQGSVAIAGRDGATAFAVLPDARLYVTSDTGSTWAVDPLSSPARAVASDGETTYVATDAGVLVRETGGWSPLPGSPRGLKRLVVTRHGLLGVGSSNSGALSTGLWRFDGDAWTQLAGDKWVSDVAVDPNDERTIAFVTNDNPYHDTTFATGVWVSRDGGRSFTTMNDGLAMTRIYSVAFDPAAPGRLVIGTNGRGFWETTLRAHV